MVVISFGVVMCSSSSQFERKCYKCWGFWQGEKHSEKPPFLYAFKTPSQWQLTSNWQRNLEEVGKQTKASEPTNSCMLSSGLPVTWNENTPFLVWHFYYNRKHSNRNSIKQKSYKHTDSIYFTPFLITKAIYIYFEIWDIGIHKRENFF